AALQDRLLRPGRRLVSRRRQPGAELQRELKRQPESRRFLLPLDGSIGGYTLTVMAADLSLCTQCHCLAARRRARAITRHFEAELRPHGLRATQFSILAALALAGTLPMGELAELLGLERTTLTRAATLLDDK